MFIKYKILRIPEEEYRFSLILSDEGPILSTGGENLIVTHRTSTYPYMRWFLHHMITWSHADEKSGGHIPEMIQVYD